MKKPGTATRRNRNRPLCDLHPAAETLPSARVNAVRRLLAPAGIDGGDEAVHKASRPKSSSQVTLCWRERDSNHRSRSKGTASPWFSQRGLLHRAANASRGRDNVMHASHRGIGRERCGVFYVKAVRRLMDPLASTAAMRPRNGAAQDDLFAALLYQHPLAC
jgi:hypothetical protein